VLPDAPEARERWLTRDEAAGLIRAAWRLRRDSGIPGMPGRYTSRHIARYILIALYTGSRNGDICGAALMPTIGRGYVDLDRGIFKRKPDNKRATSKRQPTVPIPPRLARAHAPLAMPRHQQAFGH
jgi:integrase